MTPADPPPAAVRIGHRVARAIGVALVVSSLSPSLAQRDTASPLVLTGRDARNGLPPNVAFDAEQDHAGFLWIGTNDGLARYDGRGFVALRHDADDPSSLSHDTVRAVLEDRAHRLWVRTEAGLDRHDASTGRVRRFAIDAQQIAEPADGRLVVAAADGLHRYDPSSDTFARVRAFPLDDRAPSAADPVWGLLPAANGDVWISTRQGLLASLDADGGVRVSRLPWREASVLHEDADGRLWIGHAEGLALVDPGSHAPLVHPPFETVEGPVVTLTRQADGVVWFGGARLYTTDARGAEVTTVDIGDDPLATPIRSILVDREGLVWLATPRGLQFHSPYAKRWHPLTATGGGRAALGGSVVMALARDGDRGLWVGSLDGGADHADERDGDRVTRHVAAAPACGRRVWALVHDDADRTWIGSDEGLCVVDGSGARVVNLGVPGAPAVYALARDRDGNVWAGTTAGLFRVDGPTRRAMRIAGVGDERDGEVNVEGLWVDPQGDLWAGTARSDLYRIDTATGAATYFPVGDAQAFRGSEGFWTLTGVGDGRLWLGSDRGLFLFDPATAALTALAGRRGLPAQPVYAIAHDDEGALWLSTSDGLLRHDNPLTAATDAPLVRHFTTDDGLPFGEFNRRAVAAGPDGWLAFGGMGGVVRFRPRDFLDNPHPPLVHVTAIERSRFDGPPLRSAMVGDVVALAADDAGVVLDLTALTFADPHLARIAYRLEGVDPDWVHAGADRRARYSALPPGRYQFTVRAANADGAWNLDGARLTLVVPAPWWATWWFRAAAALVVVVGLVAASRWLLTRRLRARVRALELDRRVRMERERISRDLHDHVGAQVSTLLAGIELAGLRAGQGEVHALQTGLSELREDAQRTMTQLRETVWSLRHEHVPVRALVSQVQDDLRDRQRFHPRPALRSAATGALDRDLGSDKALHLFRLVQESVSNAIRHSGADSVDVRVAVDDDGISVTVSDDGRFRPAPEGHRGTGLAGMRERAAEIGAAFSIETASGTRVAVRLPWGDATPRRAGLDS